MTQQGTQQTGQPSAPTASSTPLSAVENDIRGLMQQVAEMNARQRELETQHAESTKRLLLDLFEAIDAFERVFRSIRAKEDQITPHMKVWIGNFRTVRRLLDKALSEFSVARIENISGNFDPQWHRIYELVPDPEKAMGTILEEVKAGYVWRGAVLRKAEVIIVGELQLTDGEEDEKANG